MPLATIVGLPCCGKTTFAKGLVEYLRREMPDRPVILVNEENAHITKVGGYKDHHMSFPRSSDAAAEKITRGALKTGVEHAVNAKTFVILDSLNYIKGFRYELYCAARAEGTQHCVVWIVADAEISKQWNEARSDAYSPDLFKDLCSRFEAPNDSNRWDRPLIRYKVVPNSVESREGGRPIPSSPSVAAEEGTEGIAIEADGVVPPTLKETYKRVMQAMVEGKTPNVGLSTAVSQHAEADTLYLLDQVTQRIVTGLMERQKTSMPGDSINLPEATRPIVLTRKVALPELKRLRRQFVKQAGEWGVAVAQGTGGEAGSREKSIANAFLEYIHTQIS